METVKQPAVTPSKSRLARTIAKVVRIRAVTGIAPIDGIPRVKSLENAADDGVRKVNVPHEKIKDDEVCKVKPRERDDWLTGRNLGVRYQAFDKKDRDYQERLAVEAFVSKLFASISSVKAAYAQLQQGQSPYDADEIQAADEMVVSEFKVLSELKQCYYKRQFDPNPEKVLLSAEVEEQKSLLKTFEIMEKKLDSQLRLKDSEITFLREKLDEANKQNKSIEKKLNQSGLLSTLDQLHLSGLSPNHFSVVRWHTVKSIRCFVRLMIDEMKACGWDIDAAANSIEPDVVFWKADHKCFAFESFVCKEMFSAFSHPNFLLANESLPEKDKWRQLFFDRFIELKSVKPKYFLSQKPRSTFAKFCRAKYLILVHPRMESSLFGNLSQRNLIESGDFPDTPFFAAFAEMAKRVWLLHCLAFSFEPEASIFQVKPGCQFSEVYMESVTVHEGDNSLQCDSQVALCVVPGFKIGKTVMQCQVYLSQLQSRMNC